MQRSKLPGRIRSNNVKILLLIGEVSHPISVYDMIPDWQ